MTSWAMRNAMKDVRERQAKLPPKPKQATEGREMPAHIKKALDHFRETGEHPPVLVTKGRPLSKSELIEMFNIPTLSQLHTQGMTLQQASDFEYFLARVRHWREAVRNGGLHTFIVSSRDLGIGKTHVSDAVAWSFAEFLYPDNYEFDPVVLHNALVLTDDALMTILGEKDWMSHIMPSRRKMTGSISTRRNVKCIVIDDFGRRRAIPYVGKDGQAGEVEARFFQFVNWCYRERISLFFTTNLLIDEMRQQVGEAVWNRIQEMSHVQNDYIFQLGGLDSYRSKKGGWIDGQS